MLHGQRIAVVMPAFRAERTLEACYQAIPHDIVDTILLVDDARRVIESLPLAANSQDFLFDNQMLAQALAFGMRVGEVSCPARYFYAASQISFRRSLVYGAGVVRTSVAYRMWRWGLASPRIFSGQPEWKLAGAPPAVATRA